MSVSLYILRVIFQDGSPLTISSCKVQRQIYRVSTKIGFCVNILLLRHFLYNHSYIPYEVLHWGLLKFSNEDNTQTQVEQE